MNVLLRSCLNVTANCIFLAVHEVDIRNDLYTSLNDCGQTGISQKVPFLWNVSWQILQFRIRKLTTQCMSSSFSCQMLLYAYQLSRFLKLFPHQCLLTEYTHTWDLNCQSECAKPPFWYHLHFLFSLLSYLKFLTGFSMCKMISN